jgi:hypothetical protein
VVPGEIYRGAAGGALKKILLRLLGVAAATLVAFCVLPVPVVRKPLPEKSLHPDVLQTAGSLMAGAARVRIQLPEHPVLAGYAGHRRAREATEPVYARAIVIKAGPERLKAVIAAVDTLLMPLEPEFDFGECALIAATHTHTGPGGLWDNTIAGWLGAGEPDADQRAAVGLALREAIDRATSALGPAELLAGRDQWTEGPARARSEGPIDPDLVALRLRRPGGATIATLVVYAMHPTSAPHDVLSADWPRQLDSGDAPVLVLQGAVGNTTWPRDAPLVPPIASKVEALLRDALVLSEAPLDCWTRVVSPPRAQASLRVPWLFRRAYSNGLTLWGPRPFATQTRLRIGPVALLGVPGEPVGELGLAARHTVLVGLAGGYLGYVETPERWEAGLGESGKTYFGPSLANALGLWPR